MKEIFLIIMISWGGDMPRIVANEMPTMKECKQAIVSTRYKVPRGGDQEHAVVIYCSYGRPSYSYGNTLFRYVKDKP